MKAPDKIYLVKSLSFPDKIHSHWYKEDVVGNGIEYIRKDALIEMLKGYSHPLTRIVVQELIDKINKL